MKRDEIRLLWADGSPEAIGRAHGATYPDDIQEYAAERTRLAAAGTDWERSATLSLAERMLPAHQAYDPQLYAEMLAMAEAAGITAAEAVIVGGYTDFIDTVRTVAGGTAVEDTCTAAVIGDIAAGGAGFLAQTWDMHASATPHVLLLGLSPTTGPHALVFTTVGTLGQIGMNEAGIAVGINNLTTNDGRLGVTWPFVVRRALQQTTLEGAIHCVVEAPLAGGHNFLLFDRNGRGASIEATPTATHVEWLDGDLLIHTNHCLVPLTKAVEGDRPAALQRSSTDRLDHARGLLDVRPVTVEVLMALTRDERSICRRPDSEFNYETSGAVIMRPATGDFWACWGIPADNEYELHRLAQREIVR